MKKFLLLSALCLNACSVTVSTDASFFSTSRCVYKSVYRVYFGMNTPNGVVSEAEWQDFLAKVVTPLFPEGLTVIQAQGQWLGNDGTVAKEPTRILEIVKEDPEAIKKIASEYKVRFRQEAVLVLSSEALACL